MLVSTKGRYALRVMLELSRHDPAEYVPLPVVAQQQEISEKYLELIVSTLVKAGFLDGMRGKRGGYRLSRPLSQYSVGEILRVTEKSLAPVACLETGCADCSRAGQCKTLPMWEKLDSLINNYLDSVSLADLAEDRIPS